MNRRLFLGSIMAARSVSRAAAGAPPPQATGTEKPPVLGKQKLVLIGAGSAMFTQGVIIDWIRRRFPEEWEIALVDINPVILEATEKLVRRYMLSAEKPAKITATVDRKEVLPGATLVVSTIGVGSRRAWEQDVFVPRKFGIFQPVGDSVMPGGVSRSMRMIPPMLDIARDVEKLCPGARFVNYSNPMTAVVRALRRETSLPAVGLCHGTHDTIGYLAQLAGVPGSSVTAKWCGVNHLTWITEVRAEGVDLWPKIREKVAQLRGKGLDKNLLGKMFWGGGSEAPREDEVMTAPFSWELFDEFGAFPAPLDRHTTEFFPERFPRGQYYGKTLGVDAYSFEDTIAYGDKIYDRTLSLAQGEGPLDPKYLRPTGGEHTQLMDIWDSWQRDQRRWYAANVPNNGAVANLPRDAVLEIPVTAAREGMVVPPYGEVSPRLAAILLRRLAAVEATVEAAVTGDRRIFTEALILDGGISDYATAQKLTEELIAAQKQYLPQFA